ncbi:MAG: hypothetical protein AAF417_02465 [Pseudomonadota bacterium]
MQRRKIDAPKVARERDEVAAQDDWARRRHTGRARAPSGCPIAGLHGSELVGSDEKIVRRVGISANPAGSMTGDYPFEHDTNGEC